jgi:trehalose-phosphatase
VSSSLGRDDADSENEKKLSDNGQPWLSMLDGTGSAPLSSMTPMASLPPKSANAADWKQITGSIMDLYAARTHGTYVLRKSSALSWHYADADPEFGSLQAQELSDGLQGVLRGLPVDVLSGVGWIEVRPRGVSKGAVLAHIMDKLEGRDGEAAGGCPPPLEFILCVGDDNADEDMFATVQSYRTKRVAEHTSAVAALKGASSSLPPQSLTYYEYTVTVGKKPSKAAYFLDDTAQTEEVLKGLARATLRSRAAAPAAAAASSLNAPSAAAAPASALGNLTASLPISAGPPIPLSAISRPAPTGPAGTAAGAASLANLLAAGGSMLNLAGLNTNVLFDPAFATAFPGAAAAAAAAMSAAQPATGGGPRQVPAGAVSMVSFPMAFAAGGGGNLLGPSRVILSAAKPVASATDGSDSPPNGAASPPLNSAGGSSGGVAMAGGLRAGSLNALAGLFTGSTNRLAALPGGGALGPVNEDRDESRDEDECAPAKSLKSKDTKPSLALGDDSDFESEEDDVALQQQPQSAPTPNAASGPRGTFVLSAVPRAEDLNADADDDVPEF